MRKDANSARALVGNYKSSDLSCSNDWLTCFLSNGTFVAHT